MSGNGGRVSHDLSSISLSMCRALEEGGGEHCRGCDKLSVDSGG